MTTTHPEQSEDDITLTQSGQSLATLFAGVCERFGEKTAISLGEESIRYDELDGESNRVASALREVGAGAGTIVAICMERSIEMIVAMLGVVKAGAAYLPIDPAYPVQRIAETIADAAPIAVIASSGVESRLFDSGANVLSLEMLRRHGSAANVPMEIDEQSPAYVIYTSGSTGKPKGVVVSHRNVARLLSETTQWFFFTPDDVWTIFHSFAFDFSVWEIWGCLLTGGRLVIVPFTVSRSPELFHKLLQSEQVTVLNQTPSAFFLLDDADARSAEKLSLRVVIFGGEALSLGSLRGWIGRHGDARPELVNMYGITETTVHVTYRRILEADVDEHESLIGEPIPDMQLYLLDEQLRTVADGEEGEICVGGGGVSLGYLNRPELTAERFCADPAGPEGNKLYRSGDLARRRADGELVFLGRRDLQVKVNGFRIEPGEVEAALGQHPAVRRALVTAEDGRLVAYVNTVERLQLQPEDLSNFLSAKLPAHMMPSLYRHVAEFTLNGNGKVDRAGLRNAVVSPKMAHNPAPGGGSPMEECVADIWRIQLGADEVSLDDNFFDVGGTSLLLIAVRTALQERLGRDIPITWMFECTSVRSLAQRLAQPAGTGAVMSKVINNARRQREAFVRAKAARIGSR